MFSHSRLISELFGVASSVGAFFCFVGGVIGAWLSHLYGGWNASLSLLVWLVIGDYVTGLIASVIDGTRLRSRIGYIGIAKKVAMFFVVFVMRGLDVALQIHVLREMAIYFYVTNELISLLENLKRMGVPVPGQLVDVIEVFKGKR